MDNNLKNAVLVICKVQNYLSEAKNYTMKKTRSDPEHFFGVSI